MEATLWFRGRRSTSLGRRRKDFTAARRPALDEAEPAAIVFDGPIFDGPPYYALYPSPSSLPLHPYPLLNLSLCMTLLALRASAKGTEKNYLFFYHESCLARPDSPPSGTRGGP